MPRRRAKPEKMDAVLLIRLSDGQKRALADAAAKEGLGVSAWLRRLALRAAGWKPTTGPA